MRSAVAVIVGSVAVASCAASGSATPADRRAAGLACEPSEVVNATAAPPVVSADVVRSAARVVRRTRSGVTARAEVTVRVSSSDTATATATVDVCPGGVSSPQTRTRSRSEDSSARRTAVRRAHAQRPAAAKQAARRKARAAATDAAEPAASEAARTGAVDAASAAALAAARAAADPGEGNGHWSVGYYAGYEAADYPVAAIDWDGLTHLAVAFYLPRSDGTLDGRLFFGTLAEGRQLARSLIAGAHAHGDSALASIGGAGTGDELHAAMTTHRDNLVASILALRDMGYDGIDVDWEPLSARDQDLLAELGAAVRAAWPDAELTAPVYSSNINFPIDLANIDHVAATFDQVNLMTYGMAGAYEGWRSWHSSPLDGATGSTPTSVRATVEQYLAAGVPADQLGLGIGAYGLCYSAPVTAPNQSLNGSQIIKEDYNLQFGQIRSAYEPTMTRHFDGAAQAPYLSGNHSGCTYITYEDEQSIAAKLAWASDHGLNGMIMWTVNQQYVPTADEPNPLLATIAHQWLQ